MRNEKNVKEFSVGISAKIPVDFALITVIEVERKAVCEAFGLTDKHRVRRGSRVYWRGNFPLDPDRSDSDSYEIVVARSTDMANVDAALVVSDTFSEWMPNSIILVGIAGGASKEVALGDVVVGQEIYYYERGKVTSKGKLPEARMLSADATLWSNITTLPKWIKPIGVSRPDKRRVRPAVHYGVIACGEKVIADRQMRDQIAKEHRKILAIEMEGYGFSKAVYQNFNSCRHITIKAICDNADRNKSQDWQPYAAAVAAGFTKHFLSDGPIPPKSTGDDIKVNRKYITSLELTLDRPIDSFNEAEFKQALREVLGTDIDKIRIASIKSGSIIICIEGDCVELARILKGLGRASYIRQEFKRVTGFEAVHAKYGKALACREARSPNKPLSGRVAWFNERKGFGFITQENGEEICVHFPTDQIDSLGNLKKGDSVDFIIDEDIHGSKFGRILRRRHS